MEKVHQEFAAALRKVPAIVVGILKDGEAEVVALGTVADEPDPATLCWEIGSITKVFTSILLTDMSIRGEVKLEDPIGVHLPDQVAGRLPALGLQPTLTDLATHSAGLPRLPASIYRIAKRSDDPYSLLTENDVFAALGPKTRRPARRRPRYSNYGMGLLGHLLARAAGRPYAELIEERILGPPNMTATRVGSCGESTDPVPGFRKGRPAPPWTFGALEAAGGLRSTINDLLVFAGACLNPPEGSVGDALRLTSEPFHRSRLPSGSMGLGWMFRSHPKRHGSALWHNGGTYRASSFLAVDPGLSQAIVACGNSGPGLFPPLDRPSWAVFDSLGS